MENNNRFPKQARLCGDKKIGEMFRDGRSGFVFPFRYIYHTYPLPGGADSACVEDTVPNGGENNGMVSVLISVSKRYHKRANKRNLLKRRTREVYRTGNSELKEKVAGSGSNMSLGLIYSTKEVLDYKIIENAVGKIISEIVKGV